jgi:hypothetical protein
MSPALKGKRANGTAPRPYSPKRLKSLLLSVAAAVSLVACLPTVVASASSASPIERVWSFNGGEVAIQSQPGGTFVGTVVAPTQFAQCTHTVGEQMWTDIRLQPDGSYWGLHQWFYETAECVRNTTPGPTAWQVMEAANGAAYLLVCFSSPGGTQPTIAPSGAEVGVTYGCVKSTEVAPVAAVESFTQGVSLAGNKRCFSGRVFQIHLHQSRYDPFNQVLVTLGKRRLTVTRHGKVFAATVDLKGLPRGAFTVRIHVTTVLGHHLSGSRTYHTCAAKPIRSSKPKARGHS